MKKIKAHIKKFFERLSPEPEVAGCSLGFNDIRYVAGSGKGAEKYSAQIPEGVFREGVVQNEELLQKALEALHDTLLPKKKNEVIKAVISLPPGVVYTQSVKTPYVGEKDVEESVGLNLQIVTPIRAEDAYMDWQKIKEFDNEIELLGAFVERARIDKIRGPLERAKFYPVAFEFPALSLMRVIKKKEGDESAMKMYVYVGNDGIDFFMTKEGALSFDYFISWKEIQGDAGEVSGELFDETLMREARKVMNFAVSKEGKSVERAAYIAEGLEKRVEDVLRERLGLKTEAVEIEGETRGPLWYVAEGASRRKDGGEKKREVNVGAEGLQRAFFEERLIRFLRLWRNIFVGVLAVFLFIDGGMATLLGKYAKEIEVQSAGFKARGAGGELEELEARVTEFNALVQAAGKAKEGDRNWSAFLANIRRITEAKGVRITRLEVDGRANFVSMGAEGQNHSAVVELKNTLVKEPGLTDVDLPLSKIAVTESNNVTFSLTFKIKD